LALALAALGVFGVMHYSVAARTKELGIRMALGARAADVLRLVLANGAALAAAGIAAGTLAAMWLTRIIAAMLYRVDPGDPLSFAAAGLLLFVVAALATWLPALRAARIDPAIVLRQE
jgi:ABC-type antimicrobial peptide transport system permease subunit